MTVSEDAQTLPCLVSVSGKNSNAVNRDDLLFLSMEKVSFLMEHFCSGVRTKFFMKNRDCCSFVWVHKLCAAEMSQSEPECLNDEFYLCGFAELGPLL